MPKASLVITGVKEIDRRLKRLEPAVQRRVVRGAMRRGLAIIKAEIEAEAPSDSGDTRRNVKVRAVKRRKRGSIELEARIEAVDQLKRTSGKTGKTVFYPAVVQYGSDEQDANDFMTRAYDQKGEMARMVTLNKLRQGVEEQASR